MGADENILKKKKEINEKLKKRSNVEKIIKKNERKLFEKEEKSKLFINDMLSSEDIQRDILMEIPKLPYARPEIWRELGILIRQNELIRRQNETIIKELKKINK